MPKAEFSKYEYSNNEIKQKLKASDYVFEINGKDINQVSAIYSIDPVATKVYEDGKKTGNINKPVLRIELNGNDKDGNNAWITFDLRKYKYFIKNSNRYISSFKRLQ